MQQTFTVPTETIGTRLRRARQAAGLSTSDMADELDVSRNSISRWENNREPIRRAHVLAYAMRCAVPVEWLEGDGSYRTGPGAIFRNRCFSTEFLTAAA